MPSNLPPGASDADTDRAYTIQCICGRWFEPRDEHQRHCPVCEIREDREEDGAD